VSGHDTSAQLASLRIVPASILHPVTLTKIKTEFRADVRLGLLMGNFV